MMRAFIGPIFLRAGVARIAALVTLLMLGMAASQAQGACGSYVVIGQPGEEARAAMQHQMGDEPASRPCTGPQCRAQDRAPAAPLAVDQKAPASDVACLVNVRDAVDGGGGVIDLFDWSVESESHRISLDPPPRA
jgi:hypothetical protein